MKILTEKTYQMLLTKNKLPSCKACGKPLKAGDAIEPVKEGRGKSGYLCKGCSEKEVLVYQPKGLKYYAK